MRLFRCMNNEMKSLLRARKTEMSEKLGKRKDGTAGKCMNRNREKKSPENDINYPKSTEKTKLLSHKSQTNNSD